MSREVSSFVISLMPYTREGRLDEKGLRAHLQRFAAAGMGVYLGGSGSGEGYTLSPDELDRIFSIGREELAGRVPVRAMGVEPRSAAEVVALAAHVEAAGLDEAACSEISKVLEGLGIRPESIWEN